MKLNIPNAVRGLIGLSMVFAVGFTVPTALPGVSNAEAAQPRSSIERRLRPGSGYFARSSSSRPSQPAPVYRQTVPMVQPGTAVVRSPQVQHGQVVVRPLVPQQHVVQPQQRVVQPQQQHVVLPQQRVVLPQQRIVQQPQVAPPAQWVTTPQR